MMEIDYILEILGWNDSANIPATADEQTLKAKINHIIEEAKELADAGTPVDKVDAGVDLIWVIVGWMRAQGWNVMAAMDAVSQANYSKFFPVNETEQALEFAKQKGYKNPYVEVCGSGLGEFAVLKDETGKVMKPHTFVEPDHTNSLLGE